MAYVVTHGQRLTGRSHNQVFIGLTAEAPTNGIARDPLLSHADYVLYRGVYATLEQARAAAREHFGPTCDIDEPEELAAPCAQHQR